MKFYVYKVYYYLMRVITISDFFCPIYEQTLRKYKVLPRYKKNYSRDTLVFVMDVRQKKILLQL